MAGMEEILLITLVVTFVVSLIYRLMMNPAEMKRVKNDIKVHRENISKAQKAGDMKRANELTKELMKTSGKQLSGQMRPMLVSMVFFIGLLWWFGAAYAEVIVQSPVAIPFIGSELNWFWWYLIIAIPASFTFRKILDVA